jgi:hypothetical protein
MICCYADLHDIHTLSQSTENINIFISSLTEKRDELDGLDGLDGLDELENSDIFACLK